MEKKEEKQRVRKAYASKGTRGQKMVSFRLDNDNAEHLNKQVNKGRYLNELIAKDKAKGE